LHLEEYEKKNKKYYKVTQKKLLVEPQMLNFKLDNLFNGDKVLGDNINQVMNDNSKEMYADLRSSYEEAFWKIFVAVFDNLLTRVPIAQLFGED
jgi:asparagine synthetase A